MSIGNYLLNLIFPRYSEIKARHERQARYPIAEQMELEKKSPQQIRIRLGMLEVDDLDYFQDA